MNETLLITVSLAVRMLSVIHNLQSILNYSLTYSHAKWILYTHDTNL